MFPTPLVSTSDKYTASLGPDAENKVSSDEMPGNVLFKDTYPLVCTWREIWYVGGKFTCTLNHIYIHM